MASTRYGTEQYGTVYYGGDELDEFLTSNFTAQPNGYGRALVSWTRPGGAWDRQRLVRNLVGLPVDESDGMVLLDEAVTLASGSFQDEELAVGRFYYYGLFVRDIADGTWRRAATEPLIVTKDYGYTRRLFDRLPEVYKVSDYTALVQQNDAEESSFLYRWMSAFGIQLDHVRTELEGLREANNPRLVSSSLLPALARMVGVEYEPELGDRAVRRLTANAVRVSTVKGTLAGTREYSTVFTAWDATVRLGHNIALDRLDAGPDGGVGRWTPRVNATVRYEAFTDATRGPAGQGAVVITAVAGGPSVEVNTNPAGLTAPLERLQYAIPIIPNLRYVVSQYARTTVAGLTARMGMTWLDVNGEQVMGTGYGPAQALDNTWTGRPNSTELAPANARYLEVNLRVDGTLLAGDVVRACGLLVQEDSTVKAWAPAREVLIYLTADLRNFVGNTSGHGLSAEGWLAAVSLSREDAGLTSYYLSFDPSVAALDPTLILLDALAVDYTGDPAPTTTTVEVREYVALYTAGTRIVNSRETWSVLVDASALFEGVTQQVQVGFACYDGTAFIRYEWGPLTTVGQAYQLLTHELFVPVDADYDRVIFAIRSANAAVGWKNAALENVKLADARQFDGSTPSPTLDYMWEGVPYRSTSHYYSRRVVRTVRLRELLSEYLPHPASFKLIFAAASIPDSPRASHGSDLDPDDAQTTFVGVRTRSRWAVTVAAGNDKTLGWAVESLKVGVEVDSRWHLEHIHAKLGASWDVEAAVGTQLQALWDTSVTKMEFSSIWNVDENVAVSDALVVENIWGYGGSGTTKNAASAPLIDLDQLGAPQVLWLPGTAGNYVSTPDRNMLTAAQSLGSGGWGAGNATSGVTYETAAPISGSSSVRLTQNGTAGEQTRASTAVLRTPVTAGASYAARLNNKALTAARDVQHYVEFFDSAGAYITSIRFGGAVSPAVGVVTSVSGTVTAPANATTAIILVLAVGAAAGETWLIDDIQLEAAASVQPFTPSLRITGDLDLRAHVALEDWSNGAYQALIGNWGTGSYLFDVIPSGQLRLYLIDSAGNFLVRDSSVVVPFADAQAGHVRVTLDVDNGASGHTVRFYTSTDGATWTQLGTDVVTAGVIAVRGTGDNLLVGGRDDVVEPVKGKVLSASVRAGIDGEVVASYLATRDKTYAETVLADTPAAYYRLEEASGTTFADATAGGRTASLVGSAVLGGPARPSIGGNAINLTGGYVSAPSTISEAMGDFGTVEAWVHARTATTTTGATRGIISEQYPSGDSVKMTLNLTDAGFLRCGIFAGSWVEVNETVIFPTNRWVHVAATYDGATLRLFRDGVQVASIARLGTLPAGGGGEWRIGARWDGIDAPNVFDGLIDEAAFYSKALTAAQVAAHYETGLHSKATDTQVDTTGKAWTVSRTGDATAELVNRNTWAFTGTEHLTLPDRDALDFDEVTSHTVVAGSQTRSTLRGNWFSKRVNVQGYELVLESGVVFAFRGDAATFHNTGTPTKVNDGLWRVVAGDFDTVTTKATAWNNGVATVGGAKVLGTSVNADPVTLGKWSTANLRGLHNWVALFRRVLTAAEHTELAGWNGSIATEPTWLRTAATLYINIDDPKSAESYRLRNEVLNLAAV